MTKPVAGAALALSLLLLAPSAAVDLSASQDTPSSLPTSTLEFDKAFVDSRVGLSLNSAVAEGATYTVIEKVFEGGLAAAAGFREGDVVVSVNSEAVTDPDQGAALALSLLLLAPSAAIDLSASDDAPASRLLTSTLTFDKAFVDSRVGLSLNSAVADGTTYTVIETVFEGGLAAAAGFRAGDVVVSVNSEAVTDPDQGAALIKQAEGVVRVAVARLPQNAGSHAGAQTCLLYTSPSPRDS